LFIGNTLRTTDNAALINHCHFEFPSVNNNFEYLAFVIEGLDPECILNSNTDEIATQRELAAEIFRSFKNLYQLTFPSKPLPSSITNIRDNLSTSSLLSTRLFHPKESLSTLLGITMVPENSTADALKEAITLLCITHKHPLTVGGSK